MYSIKQYCVHHVQTKNTHNDIFVSIARYKQTIITATQGLCNSVFD